MNEYLLKKARKKFISAALAHELVKLDSPLNKAYAMTHGCESELLIDEEGELHCNYYCRRRWCTTCASINMASLIERYSPELAKLNDPQFVTLTIRNCTAERLPATLELMQKTWRKISDLARKKHIPFKGIRKIELKASTKYGYHPHFHIVMEYAESANWLLEQWLSRLQGYAVRDAQKIKPVYDIRSVAVEIMKYATKLTCADDTKNEPLCSAYQMDVIFQAVHGKRLIQPFGGFTAIDEEAFDIVSQKVQKAAGIYRWLGTDWWHIEYGQALTGWRPEETEIELYRAHWNRKRP